MRKVQIALLCCFCYVFHNRGKAVNKKQNKKERKESSMRRKREHNLEKKRGGCETENKEVVLELVGAELGIGYNWLEEGSIYIQFCFGKEGGMNKQKHTHSNSLIFGSSLLTWRRKWHTRKFSLLLSRQKQTKYTYTLSLEGSIYLSCSLSGEARRWTLEKLSLSFSTRISELNQEQWVANSQFLFQCEGALSSLWFQEISILSYS